MSGCFGAFAGMPAVDLCPGLNQLIEEHRFLLKKLDGLFLLTDKIEKGIDLQDNFSELKAKTTEFKTVLDPHSDREEMVLFPMMGVYIGMTTGPIAVMEYDHEQAKENIGKFLDNAETAETDEAIRSFSMLVKNAYDILTEHFVKEENVLFPMAERMLSDEEKAEFYRKIQEIQ